MGETLVITDAGSVEINGNLAVSGNIKSDSLFANLITANEITTKKLTTDELKVSTDSATMIIADSGFAALATSSAQINSNAIAGTATLPAGKTSIIINNPKVTAASMVYLTPNGSTNNQVLYVKDKFVSPTPTLPALPTLPVEALAKSGFTIALDNPLATDIAINWWIIN
jgi:hypothetical protein